MQTVLATAADAVYFLYGGGYLPEGQRIARGAWNHASEPGDPGKENSKRHACKGRPGSLDYLISRPGRSASTRGSQDLLNNQACAWI